MPKINSNSPLFFFFFYSFYYFPISPSLSGSPIPSISLSLFFLFFFFLCFFAIPQLNQHTPIHIHLLELGLENKSRVNHPSPNLLYLFLSLPLLNLVFGVI